MKRTKHSLSHYKLLTGSMGKLIPCGVVEVLPGDTFRHSTSALIRVTPLNAPVMHPVHARIHHFFVPTRILMDDPTEWESFITGGEDGEGDGVTLPTISTGGSGAAVNSLFDYFGIPTGVANKTVLAFPFRAYNKIYNEYFRRQELIAKVSEDQTTVLNISWEKDQFVSATPDPQKGPDVSLPLGTRADIKWDAFTGGAAADNKYAVFNMSGTSVTVGAYGNTLGAKTGNLPDSSDLNLYTDLTNATAVNVNDVRRAFALQRYQEARAMYGSRLTEYLAYLGIKSSDARLQRPEYLGGGKQTFSWSEILQTAPDAASGTTGADGVGNLKGHGIGAMRTNGYMRFFEEHGYIISLLSVRPRTMYATGLHRMWSRTTKEDFWQKELEDIGQQEIYKKELYLAGANNDTVFGYQPRYADYMSVPSQVAGDFRSSQMNYWHLARLFAAEPSLNQSFVECDPSTRIFQVESEDPLWCMVSHSVQARRMVKRTGVGRIM